MASAVHAQSAVKALELILEAADGGGVFTEEEVVESFVSETGGSCVSKVATLAAWVVAELVLHGVFIALHGRSDGAHVNDSAVEDTSKRWMFVETRQDSLNKRTAFHAAAALARRQPDLSSTGNTPVMREELAITPETSVTAVKYRRRSQIVLILEPVPVGKDALVTAVVTEYILPKVDNISVPGEEVSGAVDEVGQVDVDCDKLVKVILRGGKDGVDPRTIPEAVDSLDVILSLTLGHHLPALRVSWMLIR